MDGEMFMYTCVSDIDPNLDEGGVWEWRTPLAISDGPTEARGMAYSQLVENEETNVPPCPVCIMQIGRRSAA